jgi:hypothetical protein
MDCFQVSEPGGHFAARPKEIDAALHSVSCKALIAALVFFLPRRCPYSRAAKEGRRNAQTLIPSNLSASLIL